MGGVLRFLFAFASLFLNRGGRGGRGGGTGEEANRGDEWDRDEIMCTDEREADTIPIIGHIYLVIR